MANSIRQGLHHTPTGTCHGNLLFYDFWVCGNKLLIAVADNGAIFCEVHQKHTKYVLQEGMA
jgi:hypothetical protein